MKWKDIAKSLVKVAPILGGAVGGPAGGAIGALIANKFNVKNDPQAIMKVIKEDPDAFLKLKQIETENEGMLTRIVLETEAQKMADINQTMRTESVSEHWIQYSWRPFIGFATGLSFMFVSVLCCLLAYQAVIHGKLESFSMIPQMVASFSTLFAIPGGILGVSAWHRGKEKIEMAKS